jgi:acetylornithine deacetylase/succinyl-diaminopimelate desuccinylase-like protein
MTARDALPEFAHLNEAALARHIQQQWGDDIVARLTDYIKVPAKSPGFDPDWAKHGYLQHVAREACDWVLRQRVDGLSAEVISLPGRTPVIYFDVPATGRSSNAETVLLYGHLDKQPEMTGWVEGFGPWQPRLHEEKLYGRGSADDGYAVYAAIAAIQALDDQKAPRPRCVGVIETDEESGSGDLPAYLELLAPRMGDVRLVVALDSGAGNYDQLWVTTSLRGLVNGTLDVRVLNEGVHSGDAGGVVPSSFRIARQLLDRLDDARTGMIRPDALQAPIPEERLTQAREAARILGDSIWQRFPWDSCCNDAGARIFVEPTTRDPVELILNRTWRAALAVTGADGLPPIDSAGNVLRPHTALKLSLRLPPTVAGEAAASTVQALLERDPPSNAVVRFRVESAATGWNASPLAPWLARLLDGASESCFGRPAAFMGEGGTIPFMGMLAAKFPAAQMLVTGVLGPRSNAHGPNEFLHLPYARKVTQATAMVIAGAAAMPRCLPD